MTADFLKKFMGRGTPIVVTGHRELASITPEMEEIGA
jgi:hypothetical protein